MFAKEDIHRYDGLGQALSQFSDVLKRSNAENFSRLIDRMANSIIK